MRLRSKRLLIFLHSVLLPLYTIVNGFSPSKSTKATATASWAPFLPMKMSASSHADCVTIVRVTCDEAEPVMLREGVAQLFKLYFDELYKMGCDLGFQGFQSEWEDLPGKYDFKKQGGLFVAVKGQQLESADQIVGCIALRPLEGRCGEVKRMFIRATSRRNGVGNLLAKAVIGHAWEEGYSEIKLDSLERLVSTKFVSILGC